MDSLHDSLKWMVKLSERKCKNVQSPHISLLQGKSPHSAHHFLTALKTIPPSFKGPSDSLENMERLVLRQYAWSQPVNPLFLLSISIFDSTHYLQSITIVLSHKNLQPTFGKVLHKIRLLSRVNNVCSDPERTNRFHLCKQKHANIHRCPFLSFTCIKHRDI